jgi:MerR HTH family regulatory protein
MSVRARMTTTSLVVRTTVAESYTLEELAREAGVHPELVRRLVAMGVLDPGSPDPELWPRATATRLARAIRLRRDLGLNYAGALLVAELLERIDELELRARGDESTGR